MSVTCIRSTWTHDTDKKPRLPRAYILVEGDRPCACHIMMRTGETYVRKEEAGISRKTFKILSRALT